MTIEATAIIARTQLLVADDQGRVRLPDAMIAHARLKDRVAFVGKSREIPDLGLRTPMARSKPKRWRA